MNKRSFSPCESCEAGPILENGGTLQKKDFAKAVTDLERLSNLTDDCGNTIPLNDQDYETVANICDLSNIVGVLKSCIESKQTAKCTANTTVTIKISSGLL